MITSADTEIYGGTQRLLDFLCSKVIGNKSLDAGNPEQHDAEFNRLSNFKPTTPTHEHENQRENVVTFNMRLLDGGVSCGLSSIALPDFGH